MMDYFEAAWEFASSIEHAKANLKAVGCWDICKDRPATDWKAIYDLTAAGIPANDVTIKAVMMVGIDPIIKAYNTPIFKRENPKPPE